MPEKVRMATFGYAMKKRYLTVSLTLHLAVLLTALLNSGGQGKGKGDKDGGGKGQNQYRKNGEIIPKVVEVELVEPAKPKEKDAIVKAPEIKKPAKGVSDCVSDLWYGGIGISQDYLTGKVEQVAAGYPADKAGLKVDDIIQNVVSEDGPEIRGKPGTPLTLMVLRPSTGETLVLNLTRDKVCIGGKK